MRLDCLAKQLGAFRCPGRGPAGSPRVGRADKPGWTAAGGLLRKATPRSDPSTGATRGLPLTQLGAGRRASEATLV